MRAVQWSIATLEYRFLEIEAAGSIRAWRVAFDLPSDRRVPHAAIFVVLGGSFRLGDKVG